MWMCGPRGSGNTLHKIFRRFQHLGNIIELTLKIKAVTLGNSGICTYFAFFSRTL